MSGDLNWASIRSWTTYCKLVRARIMTSQCCPTTSTRSSTSLLRDEDSNDSTPRLESMKAHPARRSESKDEARESCPGAELDKWAADLALAPREDGRNAWEFGDMGKWRMMVMAYIGLFRMGET